MDKIYIVMDFVEHDLKALMETMTQSFLSGKLITSNGLYDTLWLSLFAHLR